MISTDAGRLVVVGHEGVCILSRSDNLGGMVESSTFRQRVGDQFLRIKHRINDW